MAGDLGPAWHVTRCPHLSGDDHRRGDVAAAVMLMIIISITICCGLGANVGARQHDSCRNVTSRTLRALAHAGTVQSRMA
jgi:hypothetical protein